jgi:hypothetical protein
VEGELREVTECNCSICSKKGSLLWFVPRERLRLLAGNDTLSTYTFGSKQVRHRFCATCGIHPYGEGADTAGNAIAAINVRCLEDVDLSTLRIEHFDGRSL